MNTSIKYDARRYAQVAALAAFMMPASATAQDLNDWQWGWEIYGWMPDIKGTTANGVDIDISLSDILENLDFTLQTTLSATRGNWTLFADGVYLKQGFKERVSTSRPIGNFGRTDIDVNAKIDVKTLISTFGAGFKVFENEKTKLNVLGGVRYTYLKVGIDADVEGNTRIDILGREFKRQFKKQLDLDDSDDLWDGVVGLQGETKIDDRWTLLYYGDIGTGDSDLTWQASVGVSYAFENFDVTLRYRHLKYDLGSSAIFDDLKVAGPQIGIRFRF